MRRPPSSTLRGGTSLEHTPGTRSALGRAAVLCLLLLQLVGTTSPALSGSGVAVGLCILNLLSIASATSTTLTYTTTNDNTHRGTCHTAARCVGNLNDGVTGSSGWTASNDWLPSGITAANMATKAWVIMDLGSSNTQCVGKIGVYQINQ